MTTASPVVLDGVPPASGAVLSSVAGGSGLPESLPPFLIERLIARAAAATNAAHVTTNAPYTGAPLADLPVATPADVEEAFARGRAAQSAWAANRKAVLPFTSYAIAMGGWSRDRTRLRGRAVARALLAAMNEGRHHLFERTP